MTRRVWFTADEPVDCPVYRRDDVPTSARIDGPAIVQEYASTTLVGPGDRVDVMPTGELLITVGGAS